MKISTFGRPQTAPRLESDGNRLEIPGGLGDLHASSQFSSNRPKTHRELQRPIRHRSPVPHSFRHAPVEGFRPPMVNPSKLRIGSKSSRQISRANSAETPKSPSHAVIAHHQDDQIEINNLEVDAIEPSRVLDNETFHNTRKAFYEDASDRDKAALKLGRLILSTILTKPEISVADSISRFFTDVWLSKSGTNSTLETTDVSNLNLLASLHSSMTTHNPGPEASVTQIATSQKSIAAVACEALDTLIHTFGRSNPILTDIKEALLPVIFMNPPSSIKTSDDQKMPLTGQSYMNLPTWCEDTATLIEEMQTTERSLVAVRKENVALEKDRDHFKSLYEKMVQEHGQAQGKVLSTTREQERLRELYRNVKTAHKSLEEEHAKLVASSEAEREHSLREKKLNSNLAIRLEELKDKHSALLTEKRRGDDLRATQQQEIAYLKTEVTKQKELLSGCQEEYKALMQLNKKYLKDYEEANNYRLDQSQKYQEAMDRIEKSINTPAVNFTMGNKVLTLIRGPQQNVIEILESWNVELLERNTVLEAELAATDVNRIVASALQAQKEIHDEHLAALAKTHQSMLDGLRKTKESELNGMRVAIDQVRNELFETQIDRNRVEDLLKLAESSTKEVELKFERTKLELEKRMEFSTTTKVRFQDRVEMLVQDNLYEMLLREQQALCLSLRNEIEILVQDSSVQAAKLLDTEENLEIANERLADKVLEINNLKATSMEAVADMARLEERIEFLSRPNNREQALEATVEQLRGELRQQEREAESLSAQLKSASRQRQSYRELLDWGGMAAEDSVAQMVRECEQRLRSAETALLSKAREARELQQELQEMEVLRRMVQRSEQHLMAHEDRSTKSANLMARVLRAQRSLLASAATSFRTESEEVKELEDFDLSEMDREENQLRELLQKEKEAHSKTKARMSDKMSAELVKQHELELQRQEAVAQVFRLEEELGQLGQETAELRSKLRMTEESLWLAGEDLSSFKASRTKRSEDRATETAPVADLEPSSQPAPSSSRRTSLASVRIPRPKATGKSGKPRERVASEEELEGDEDRLEEEGEERVEAALCSSRRRSSSSKKPKPTLTNSSGSGSGSARRLSVLPKAPASPSKMRTISPGAVSGKPPGRRNTEFFPSKAKTLVPAPVPSPAAGRKSSNPEPREAEAVGGAVVPELAMPTSTEEILDELTPLAQDSRATSARLLSSYSRTRSKSFQLERSESSPLSPALSRKESLAENERLVDLAQEKAALLSKSVIFDSSISTQSSSNYFFDILELRERRNIFENSRLKMILREATGLVKRLEEKLSKLAMSSTQTPADVSGRRYSAIQEMRRDIEEHSWIFQLKPEQVTEGGNEVLKDAILVGGRVKTLAAYDADLVSLAHCKEVFPDVKCTIGVEKLSRHVEGLRKEMERTIKRVPSGSGSGKGGAGAGTKQRWRAVLFRSDGSVDANMSMTGWSAQEKNEAYAEIVTGMVAELEEKTKRFNQEVDLLREIQRETERKRSEEEERANQLEELPQTRDALHKKEDYLALAHCVADVILLIQHLTGDPASAGDDFRDASASQLSVSWRASTQRGQGNESQRSLYGNSALIWKKILKRQHEASLKGSKGDSLHLPLRSRAEPTEGSSASVCAAPPSDGFDVESDVKALVAEAGLMCEKLTEKILYPDGVNPAYQNPFQHRQPQQESSQLLVGDDAFISHASLHSSSPPAASPPPPSPASLLLAPELIFQSDRLNTEINSHRRAIKALQEKQRALLCLNLESMKIEAEKYYAGTLRASSASESVLKWSSVFAQGSGSLFTRELLQRPQSSITEEPPENYRAHEGEFPVLERRMLSAGRPSSAQPQLEQQPSGASFSSFLALPDYRPRGIPPNLSTPVLERRRLKRSWRG